MSQEKMSCHTLKWRRKDCCFLSSHPKHQKSVQKTEKSLHMMIWPPDLPVLPASCPLWKNKPQRTGFLFKVTNQPQSSPSLVQIFHSPLLPQKQVLIQTTKSLAPWRGPRRSFHAGRCWSLRNLKACVPLMMSQEIKCSPHRQKSLKVLSPSCPYLQQGVSHTWLVFQQDLSLKPRTRLGVSYIQTWTVSDSLHLCLHVISNTFLYFYSSKSRVSTESAVWQKQNWGALCQDWWTSFTLYSF